METKRRGVFFGQRLEISSWTKYVARDSNGSIWEYEQMPEIYQVKHKFVPTGLRYSRLYSPEWKPEDNLVKLD